MKKTEKDCETVCKRCKHGLDKDKNGKWRCYSCEMWTLEDDM